MPRIAWRCREQQIETSNRQERVENLWYSGRPTCFHGDRIVGRNRYSAPGGHFVITGNAPRSAEGFRHLLQLQSKTDRLGLSNLVVGSLWPISNANSAYQRRADGNHFYRSGVCLLSGNVE